MRRTSLKNMIILNCFLLLIGMFAVCANVSDQVQAQTKQNETEASSEGTKEASDVTSSDNKETMEQTGYTVAVPSSYKTASDYPGTVTRLDYDSKDYAGNGAAITKTAYIGFGLGTGTVAEGWIDRAVEFWERNMKNK